MDEEREIANYLYEFTDEELKAYRKESFNNICRNFSGIIWEEQRFLNEMASKRIQET